VVTQENQIKQKLGMEQTGQKLHDLNTARAYGAGAGAVNTSALAVAGIMELLILQLQNLGMEQTWTEVNDLNTTRNSLSGSGTATSALAFGGGIPPGSSTRNRNLEWNKLD
jgi:hypothetical protein